MTTKVFTAHLPLPLAEKIDQTAARMDRSRGWVAKEALAEVAAGALISHSAVLA